MSWVVDTCLLLDVALKDSVFGIPTAAFLDSLRDEGLTVCPVSLVEISPAFDGNPKEVRNFLRICGAESNENWDADDTDAAAQAWARYVHLKKLGMSGRRPVADILIGGFAMRFQGLLTRNAGDFKPFFPRLRLRHP